MPTRFLAGATLVLLFLFSVARLPAQEITLPILLHSSTAIAIVEIKDVPSPGMDDAAFDPKLIKQRADAKLIQLVRGYLPETFRIENENHSIITPGRHLAFLRRVEEGRYILSTPGSLRRIRDDRVYWFPHDYVPLSQALAEIK